MGSCFFRIFKQSLKTGIFAPPDDGVGGYTKENSKDAENSHVQRISAQRVIIVKTIEGICQEIDRIQVGEKGCFLGHYIFHVLKHHPCQKATGHDYGEHHSYFDSF